MIDQNLITQTTEQMTASISNSTQVNDQLYLLNNVFPEELLKKLRKTIEQTDDWAPLEHQEWLNRSVLHWVPDSAVEELHMASDNLTDMVNNFFNINVEFQCLQIWRDQHLYDLNTHQDNPVIDVALQVYLWDCPEGYGTTFYTDNKQNVVDIPFKHNTGYLLWKKSNEERIPHRTSQVFKGDSRYSLYLTWSRFGKQAPNPGNPAGYL